MTPERQEYLKNYRQKNKEEIYRKKKEWNKRNSDKLKNTDLQIRYGITLEEFYAMAEEQNNKCKICNNTESSGRHLSVDHCHTTGTVRGLLCNHCNKALGHFKDDQQLLSNAIEYLKTSPF